MDTEALEPPFPLTLSARRHWDRIANSIFAAGRWQLISHDLLAQFCQTLVMAQECLAAILQDGVLVAGSRTGREKIRHPLLTPLSQSQSMLVKLARAIPLVDPKLVDRDGNAADAMIDAMMADYS